MEIGSQITFGGLATGLDTRAIIDALLSVEQIPIIRLQNKKTVLSRQDDIYAQLDSRLDDLRTAVEALDTAGELSSFTATSSDESLLGVSAGGMASVGSYDIDIVALAESESRATGGYADQDATNVGNGSFTITVDGTAHTVDLSATPTNTLQDVRNAINESGAPVTASIIDNGTGSNHYQLVVSSDTTGAANAFSVDLTGFTGHDPALFNLDNSAATSAGGSQLQAGQDSHIKVNNLDVYRSTNTVTDVLEDVTFNLNAVTTSSVQVTVSTDTEGVKSKIQDFIDAYNDIISIIDGQNEVNDEGQTSAVLFGDSGLRSVASRLRTALSQQATSTGSVYSTLAAIGITSDSDGRLNIDSADLDDAIEGDLEGVLSLFTNTTDGLASTLKTTIDELADPVDGIIKARRDGIASRKDNIDDRIEALEQRLGRYEERLINRFASMEILVSSFQAQGAALSNALMR